MSKTLGYRLFRLGRVPKTWRKELEAEDILCCDEGVPVEICYRNYQAPGKRFGYKRSSNSGSIVVSGNRLAIFFARWPILVAELGSRQMQAIHLEISAPNVLQITFDAHALDSQRSGSVQIAVRTALAAQIERLVE